MRADRLVAIVLLLQTRGQLTAAELAELLETSERTIRRDLDSLLVAGTSSPGPPRVAGPSVCRASKPSSSPVRRPTSRRVSTSRRSGRPPGATSSSGCRSSRSPWRWLPERCCRSHAALPEPLRAGGRLEELEAAREGWRRFSVLVPHTRAAAVRLAPFGADVRVEDPAEVRDELARIGRELVAANMHGT